MSDRRPTGHERLDESETGRGYRGLARASYAAMNVSSRYMGSIRAIRDFLQRELKRYSEGGPLRILDLGAGECDIAESVVRWERDHGSDFQFTCLDNNFYAVKQARRRLRDVPDSVIRVRHESVEDHTPRQPYDCAIGSLFFHHFTNPEIIQLMERLRPIVQRSVFINDLRRSSPAFLGFLALGPFMHPGVWHDGLMSIRRGFRKEQLRSLLQRLPNVSVTARHEPLFRVTARVRFL